HTHTHTHTQPQYCTHTPNTYKLLKPVLSSPPSDSCHFTLDPNTAQENLHLSEGNRRVELRDEVHGWMGGLRCCVERVCLDAATGRLSGVGGRGLIYQSDRKRTRVNSRHTCIY